MSAVWIDAAAAAPTNELKIERQTHKHGVADGDKAFDAPDYPAPPTGAPTRRFS
jgi:hypothetical protein